MRVIAGKARGIRLNAPVGREIRPTLDRVRESLFNILGPRIGESRFLDLFAGTGAVGLEALSRGAERVTFVDSDLRALKTVRENLARTKMVGQVRCARLTLPRELPEVHGIFDLVFADPPYRFAEYAGLLNAIANAPFLAGEALIVLEHRRDAEVPDSPVGLSLLRRKAYGDTALSFYTARAHPPQWVADPDANEHHATQADGCSGQSAQSEICAHSRRALRTCGLSDTMSRRLVGPPCRRAEPSVKIDRKAGGLREDRNGPQRWRNYSRG